jgi:hypothetical protein
MPVLETIDIREDEENYPMGEHEADWENVCTWRHTIIAIGRQFLQDKFGLKVKERIREAIRDLDRIVIKGTARGIAKPDMEPGG